MTIPQFRFSSHIDSETERQSRAIPARCLWLNGTLKGRPRTWTHGPAGNVDVTTSRRHERVPEDRIAPVAKLSADRRPIRDASAH